MQLFTTGTSSTRKASWPPRPLRLARAHRQMLGKVMKARDFSLGALAARDGSAGV
jgi:hypothetical protein